jgi:excisionase family DNA binding protein
MRIKKPRVTKPPTQPSVIPDTPPPSAKLLLSKMRHNAAKPIQAGRMLTVKEAAIFLGVSERWIRRRIARRLLPHRRLSGIVFLRSELEQFIETLPGVSVAEAKKNLDLRGQR